VDVLEQLKSALTGRYLIERQIGQGGMATVYLARDVRHERYVALKVLNPELGAVVGMERFLAEIRVTANLQHPHLLPLFDSGQAEGQLFYVMPYVQGESLRDRIRREKQLPVDEALRITSAVGSALDYAHRHGVIHRDLKPENILLQEGQPLVADFGIALAVSNAGGARITQTGLSLGTPHYMSPEQATGDRVIDGRTDIYSLGAVLYEMLTGDPPHTGSTAQAIIAKVLTDKPRSVRLSRDTVQPHVEAAIECALAKLPADRFATAHEFVDALHGARPVTIPAGLLTPGSVTTDPALAAARRRARIRAAIPWSIAALALAAAATLWVRPAQRRVVGRFLLTVSDSARFRSPGGVTIALSRDGSRLVYTGGPESDGQLYIRDLTDLESKPIRGTERASNPIFSPDGRSLLFTAEGRLKRVGIEGGTAITIADSGGAASWGDRDVILFQRAARIYRTTANGGASVIVAGPDSAKHISRVAWPHLLPGSQAALVAFWKEGISLIEARLGVVKLSDGSIVDLGVPGTNPRYLPTGHVVFGRSDGSVYCMAFDVGRLRVTGPAVPLIEQVIIKPGGAAEVAVSDDGTMIYRSGTAARRLVRVDRRGTETVALKDLREYSSPRISPDGKRIAVVIGASGAIGLGGDVWVFDAQSGALTRLTQGGGDRPEWTSDGKNVVTIRSDSGRVSIQPWDASGTASPYLSVPNRQVFEISMPLLRRGYLAVRLGSAGPRDIWIAPVDSPRTLRPFLATNAGELMPAVSPDGRQLAYLSDESGRLEVYVRPMPGPGARVQISTDGGSEPMWSPNGQEVFYRAGGKVMLARIAWRGDAATVTREALFDDSFISGGPGHSGYSVAPDGNHFMFAKSGAGNARTVVTMNWFEEVRQRMNLAKQR
jgi:serine/threonine-protein kinase